MHFHEQATNTIARGSSGAERSRWRDEGVDPELVADPYDVAEKALRQREERARLDLVQSAQRPLGALVAERAAQMTEATQQAPDPGAFAVNLSLNQAY